KTAHYYLDLWRKAGVLIASKKPSYYVLEQTFSFEDQTLTRRALIGMGHLHEYKEGIIYPHEQTLRGPKVDRLELLRATQINLGQIFMLYDDPAQTVQKILDKHRSGQPFFSIKDDEGITQTLFRVDDEDVCGHLTDAMAEQKLYIADGHHRYETALAYSAESGVPYHMMSFVNIHDPGLRILPTHRLINLDLSYSYQNVLDELQKQFSVKRIPVPKDLSEVKGILHNLSENSLLWIEKNHPTELIQLTLQHSPFLEESIPSLKTLDVYVLHQAILEPILGITQEDLANHTYITYKRDPVGTLSEVVKHKQAMGFLLKPTGVEQVIRVAQDRQTMPQKSTDFYPKLLTGYVMADVSSMDVL
ncbi:MAG: DUF1015 domain-containing protein, partial [Candidatus Margulisiibacteriota bacterium]